MSLFCFIYEVVMHKNQAWSNICDVIKIFAPIGTAPQGLTKAETIQVKGNEFIVHVKLILYLYSLFSLYLQYFLLFYFF